MGLLAQTWTSSSECSFRFSCMIFSLVLIESSTDCLLSSLLGISTIWLEIYLIMHLANYLRTSHSSGSDGKESAMQETRVWSLGQEDPLVKGTATHSSILAWRIPWTEKPGRLQSLRLQRIRHDWETKCTHATHCWHCTATFGCLTPDFFYERNKSLS